MSSVLHAIGLEKYLPNLEQQEVDFTTLINLTESDLKELGISTLGARKKIMAAQIEIKKKIASFSSPSSSHI